VIDRILPLANFNIHEKIRQAAEGGDPFAQFELALALDYGNDGEQDFEKASDWYAKAASQGHDAAEGNLLVQHVLGQASLRQPEVVFTQLKKRAESGDRESECNLGLCYQHGYGTSQNYEEAAAWFLRAAQAGLPMAQFNLGGLYYEGKGLQKDLGRAVEWYTRAAQQREELALLQLGSMYQKGLGVELNLNRAVVLYLIAYKRGSTRAANHLGFMFKKGLGVEQDDSLAYELYLKSLGGPDTPDTPENISYRGTAYYWLGSIAEKGEGVERDLRTAKRWYSRGAACGQTNCIEAMSRLRSKAAEKRCRNKRS
jgi:TPR repeat protein